MRKVTFTEETDSRGRRLFSALKDFQRYVLAVRPAPELRPSEFAMLHSILCCLSRQSDGPGVMIGELSAVTHQTPSGVSQTVRALEEK